MNTPATVTNLDDRRPAPKILGAVQQVRAYSQAKGSARAVLNVLATYANADGGSLFVGHARLSRETGLDRQTVRRALRKLEDMGELVCLVRGHGSTTSRYRITLSPAVDNPVENDRTRSGGGINLYPGEVSDRPPGRYQVDTQPKVDRSDTGGAVEFPDHCPDHRRVEDPPPCRKCQRTREANDAIRSQLAKGRVDEDRRRRLEEARQASAAAAASRVPADAVPVDYREARRALRKHDK